MGKYLTTFDLVGKHTFDQVVSSLHTVLIISVTNLALFILIQKGKLLLFHAN